MSIALIDGHGVVLALLYEYEGRVGGDGMIPEESPSPPLESSLVQDLLSSDPTFICRVVYGPQAGGGVWTSLGEGRFQSHAGVVAPSLSTTATPSVAVAASPISPPRLLLSLLSDHRRFRRRRSRFLRGALVPIRCVHRNRL